MSIRTFLISCFGLTLLVFLIPPQLLACALCIGFPEKTASDHLLESQCVLLARYSPDNPFEYAPNEILKGEYDGTEIGLLVDSRTRRILSGFPSRQVLLVQNEPGGKWKNLGIVSKEYLKVVRRILVLKAEWDSQNGNLERCNFFLPFFDHADPGIRQLAYLEASRAPYSVIKQLGRTAPRKSYEHFLKDPMYLKWRSLAILLLAQSDRASDRQLVVDSFRSAQRLGLTINLAAWAAAAVEVEGSAAIDFIEQNYFSQEGNSHDEIRAVADALAIIGAQSDTVTQDRIVDSYRQLIRLYPVVAADIADDLQKWKRFELVKDMSTIISEQDSIGYEARKAIRQYIRAGKNLEVDHE